MICSVIFGCFLLLFMKLGPSTCSTIVRVPLGSELHLPCLPNSTLSLAGARTTWNHSSTSADKTQLRVTPQWGNGTVEVGCEVEGWEGERWMKIRNRYTIITEHSTGFDLRQVVRATAGDNVILDCPLASPAPPVWLREAVGGGLVCEGSEALQYSIIEGVGGSVKLHNLTEEASGFYSCCSPDRHTLKKVELIVEALPPPRCLGYTEPWERCEERAGPENATLGGPLTEFSVKLYQQLSRPKPTQNLLFSPISIAGALNYLLLGARGETRQALVSALSLQNVSSCVHALMSHLRTETKDSLDMSSQIYYSPELKMMDTFLNQSQQFYATVPEMLTDSSAKNVKMINNWVAQKTQNKITELVDSVPTTTQLVLLNAVYFNGKWKVKFAGKSRQASFRLLSGDIVTVPTVYSSKYELAVQYDLNLHAQVAAFPLSGQNRLFIILPHNTEDLSVTEGKLTHESITQMVKSMAKVTPEIMEVTLPKIKLDIKSELNSVLGSMGLEDLFGSPNLCGFFQEAPPDPSSGFDLPVYLTDARHHAYLSLTEKGVEAGAATMLSFARSFSSFSALRPFLFLLWSDLAESPLFMGRLTEP